MSKIDMPAIFGCIAAILGLTVIYGWLAHSTKLVQIFPDFAAMVPNTAYCFILSGIALTFSSLKNPAKRYLIVILGLAIVSLAFAVALQNIVDSNFGLDQWLIKIWLNDSNPVPGRMAPNTACCFIVIGLIFAFAPFAKNTSSAIFIQISIYLVFLISLLGCIGYTLDLSFLYNWYHYTRMAVHTAAGLILLCIGLWFSFAKSMWYQAFYAEKEDRKLLVFSSAILLSVALTAGLIGFSLTAQQTEISIKSNLLTILNGKQRLFKNTINSQINFLKSVEQHFNKYITRSNSLSIPDEILHTLILHNYKAVSIVNKNGVIIYSTGQFTKNPAISSKLNYKTNPVLFWNNGWGLQISYPIKQHSNIIMTIHAEQLLPELSRLTETLHNLSEGMELVLCRYETSNVARCFPNQFNKAPFSIVLKTVNLRPLLMLRALAGEKDVTTGYDYRNNSVLAAFTPIENTNLGMVLKIETNKIYEQTRSQLNIAVPIILLIILIGIGLLYLLTLPLVKNILINQRKLQESEQRFKASFENAAIGMALISLKGQWLKVNTALCNVVGYSTVEMLNHYLHTFIYALDTTKIKSLAQKFLEKHILSYQTETQFIHKNGHIIWINISISLVRGADDTPLYFISQIQDISERKSAEESLQKANKDLALHNIENQTISELISNLQACERLENAYPSITNCCAKLFHYCSGIIYLKQTSYNYFTGVASWGNTQHNEHIFYESDCFALTSREFHKHKNNEKVHFCRHTNGAHFYHCFPLVAQNEHLGVLYLEFNLQQTQIEERQYPTIFSFTEQFSLAIANIKLREYLHYESTHDPLTGLYNRRHLDSFLQKEIFKIQRAASELAVIILDIDHFKAINDTYGHEIGDTVLNKLGQLLTGKMRKSDIACRYGGEEFVLILSNITATQVHEWTENLRLAISKLKFKTHTADFFSITASFGIAMFPQHGTLPEHLLSAADQALYSAKHNGRNQVVIYRV